MPLYSYKCGNCQNKQDVFKSLAQFDRTENCPKCHHVMFRQIVAPAVHADYAGYSCPITGDWIEGRRAHEENLKKHGCRVLESGETEGAKRASAAAEVAFDKEIESTVEGFIETLPTVKKEQLAAEMQSGLDVEIVRN